MALNFQDEGMSAKYRNEYIYIHKWVNKTYGKANCCSLNKKHKSKVFEWANISKKYKRDIRDWIQLCQSCHRKRDWTENQKNILRERNMGNKYHVKKIIQMDMNGNFIKEWESGRAVAKAFGICPSSVSNLLRGKTQLVNAWRWSF